MITFPTILGPDGGQLVLQTLTPPAVYLDTWAIRYFAEDNPGAGSRFRTALLRAGGTLVFSDLNIAEFTLFDDPRHARAAGLFIDSLAPHLFFTKFDPFLVMKAEVAIMVRQTDQSAAWDSVRERRDRLN